MKTLLIAAILASLALGCGTIYRQIAGSDHAAAVERSKLDSTIILSLDTVFVAGVPMWLYTPLAEGRIGIMTLDHHDLMILEFGLGWSTDTSEYKLISGAFSHPMMMKTKRGTEHAIRQLIDRRVLLSERVDGTAAAELFRRGIFRTYEAARKEFSDTFGEREKIEGGSRTPAAFEKVLLKNKCRNSVQIFLGESPGYGKGTFVGIAGNSSSMNVVGRGEKLWIVDEQRNPVTNIVVAGTTSIVEISSDGKSLSQQ